MKFFLFLLSALASFSLSPLGAQPDLPILEFAFTLDGQPITIGKNYYSPILMDSVQFETIRFYVSEVAFYQNEEKVGSAEEQYYLIDAEVPASQRIRWHPEDSVRAFQEITFKFGIDSLTNVVGAQGGALDPLKGMYWSWQSGYVNCKIEGTSPACPARQNRFQFHLGGYQFPYNSCQEVTLSVPEGHPLTVTLDLGRLLLASDFIIATEVMQPGREAVRLSEVLAMAFKLLP